MVQRPRAAGAIILAKSNMAAWYFSPYETTSSIAGITRNPYTPGDVLVETNWAVPRPRWRQTSVRWDWARTPEIRFADPHRTTPWSVFALTLGQTSRDGIIPLFLGADVGGADRCARWKMPVAVLYVVAGDHTQDPITQNSNGHIPKSFKMFQNSNGLRGARLGVFRP